jgi:ABC-2 type transport system permease protein
MSSALTIVRCYMRLSLQQEMAYRADFWSSVVGSLLNAASGLLGLVVVFSHTETIRGWDVNQTTAVLGTWLLLAGLRGIVLDPSLDALSGMNGEVWTGQFDYTLLRPVGLQFHVSVRKWRLLALLDVVLGAAVMAAALSRIGQPIGIGSILLFLALVTTGVLIVYSILLLLSSLVFLSPGFFFTWIFNALFPAGRYPLQFYPRWLRALLTWVVPVGIVATAPAGAITGSLSAGTALTSVGVAVLFLTVASWSFRRAVRKYTGASS